MPDVTDSYNLLFGGRLWLLHIQFDPEMTVRSRFELPTSSPRRQQNELISDSLHSV